MSAIYPLSESYRIGDLYIQDQSAVEQQPPPPGFIPTREFLSEALVGPLEARRLARQASRVRYSQSPPELASQLDPADGKRAFMRQMAPARSAERLPRENTLPIGGIPGYTLAAVDEGSIGAYVPLALASFFAALGIRRTQTLQMQAEGVEVADVPLEAVLATIRQACRNTSTVFGDEKAGRALVAAASGILSKAWEQRQRAAGGAIPAMSLQFDVLHRVYYLRGIRYTFNDSRVADIVAQAAIARHLPEGVIPPALAGLATSSGNSTTPQTQGASVTVNNGATASTPTPPDVAARLASIQSDLEKMRQAMATGTNIRVEGSYGRATSTGIELVDLFDRPLAFAYESMPMMIENAEDGLKPLCDRS